MSYYYRQRYLTSTFNRLHDKISQIYEDIIDGDFEPAKNNINSMMSELKELKRNLEP